MNDDHRDKPFSGTKLNINKNSGIEPEIVFYVIDDNDNSKWFNFYLNNGFKQENIIQVKQNIPNARQTFSREKE